MGRIVPYIDVIVDGLDIECHPPRSLVSEQVELRLREPQVNRGGVYLSGTWDELADFADRLKALVASKRNQPAEDDPTLPVAS